MKEMHYYTFEDSDGTEMSWGTQDYKEAREYAAQGRLLIIDHTYVWEDSEPADDYRPPKDSD